MNPKGLYGLFKEILSDANALVDAMLNPRSKIRRRFAKLEAALKIKPLTPSGPMPAAAVSVNALLAIGALLLAALFALQGFGLIAAAPKFMAQGGLGPMVLMLASGLAGIMLGLSARVGARFGRSVWRDLIGCGVVIRIQAVALFASMMCACIVVLVLA